MAIIRQQTQVFNKPIGVVRADAGGARVGEAIANAADTMGQIAFKNAARVAEKRGVELAKGLEDSKLTTFNPETGKPEAFKAPMGFGKIAADAYQRVVDARFEESVDTELRLKAREIALKYEYDADGYANVFSDYIAEMSENAEGHYKVFIQSNGAKYLASTSLNIKEKSILRSRQQLSEKLASKLGKDVDKAREAAAAGNFMPVPDGDLSEAEVIAQRSVGNASDGEKSFLLKGGASTSHSDEVNFGIAKGGLEYIISNTANPAERVALDLAIRTGGKEGMSQLPASIQEQVNALLPYISVGTKDQILQYSSVVAGDYNAQWKVEKDIAKAQAEQAAIESQINFNSNVDLLGEYAQGKSLELLTMLEYDDFGNETGARRQPSAVEVAGSVQFLSEKFEVISSNLTSLRRRDQITQAEYENGLKESRESILQNLLIPAAALGNVESLKLALTIPNARSSWDGLTQTQVYLVNEVLESGFFTGKDHDFVQSTLNGVKNTAAKKTEEMKFNYNLTKAVNIAGSMAANNSLSEDEFNDVTLRVEANIKDGGYTDVQGASHLSSLRTQRSIGLASAFAGSRGMNSRTLNQLQMYVDLKGNVENPQDFPSQVASVGNEILKSLETRTEIDAVVGKISGLKSVLTTAETKDKEAKEISALRNSISGGSADKSDLKTRETVDGMLAQDGLDLSSFNSFSNEDKQVALHYLRNGGSEVLSAALNNMADGQQVRGAESFIALYALLRYDLVKGRNETTNQLETYFNDDVSDALLKDAFNVYKIRGGNEGIDTIINELAAKRADPKAIANMNIILGTKGGTSNKRQVTPLSFAAEITGNDPSIYPELASVVEYFALTGLNKKQIKTRVEAIIDQKYPKSLNIIDTSMPIGSVTRSRKAVVKLIPDDDIRQSFYDRHNDRLAKLSKDMGMELRINDGTQASIDDVGLARPIIAAGISMAASAMGLTERVEDANVYLRPDPSGASDRYYFYYKDENNELQPLSYPADSKGNYLSEEDGGTAFWYSATPDETIGDLVAAKRSETKASLEQSADANAADQNLRVNWLTQSSPSASADFMMQRLIEGFPDAVRPSGSE